MKNKKNEINVVVNLNKENIFNDTTKNVIIATDNEILSTMDFDASSRRIIGLLGSLLIKFGMDMTKQNEEEFFLDQINKMRLKSVLYKFLDNAYEELENLFDNKFLEAGIKKNGTYLDMEAYAIEMMKEKAKQESPFKMMGLRLEKDEDGNPKLSKLDENDDDISEELRGLIGGIKNFLDSLDENDDNEE